MSMKNALLIGLLAVPVVASAGEADHWYVTPEVGGVWPNYQRSVEDQNWLFGVALGREINQYFNLELDTEGARLMGHNHADHTYLYHTTLDALAILHRDQPFAPYLRLGAGVERNAPSGVPDQTHFAVDTGVGAYVNLWRNASETRAFSLRPEVKILWDDPGRGEHVRDYIAEVGFQYSFGGAPVEASAPPPAPLPPPAPPAAAAAPAPAPAPATPATPPAAPAFQLPTHGGVALKGVTFAFNSARLEESSYPVLDSVAKGLEQHPLLEVQLQGYTDSVGSVAYNMKLSQRRAKSVRDYLLGQGVKPSQLTSRGFGPAHPVASNRTAAGRAQNRRVVLEVVSNPNDVKVKGQGTAN